MKKYTYVHTYEQHFLHIFSFHFRPFIFLWNLLNPHFTIWDNLSPAKYFFLYRI